MNEFDKMVRNAILHYPMLYRSRFNVMEYMFLTIGGSYEWHQGKLVLVHDREFSDEEATKRFFRDIETQENDLNKDQQKYTGLDHYNASRALDLKLARLEREFLQTHLDDIAIRRELMPKVNVYSITLTASTKFGNLWETPMDAHPDFLNAVKEFLDRMIPAFYYAGQTKQDNGLWQAMVDLRGKLFPTDETIREFTKGLIAQLTKDNP